ncbi:hypothetical protein WAE58_04440 [Pedobacter panaciterrae]|uniref:DUF3945 domain-containing protein n=1 Tax=Pedobacter panaciterrae TaxID=363849 RepID=A0ABU8NHD7_9SPHI
MNLNNLEDRKTDMTALGVSNKNIELMEAYMKDNVTSFVIKEIIPASRGQVEISIPFKQSGQSEFYYFNRFTAAHNKARPLEEGHKYFVVMPDLPKKDGKTQYKSFEHSSDAIGLFNELKNGELKSGKDLAGSGRLALMEEGKLNYVSKDFRATLFTKPMEQNFWMDKGKGFTVAQAANMIQGRSVYKDDLVNASTGEIYKAWVKLDLEGGKENGNFKLNQFHDPQYGFDLNKVLESYKIKELEDPAKREALEVKLRNGERPVVTVEKYGQTEKVFIETAVRYGKLNFFALDGKMEKRELFQKEPAVAPELSAEKGNLNAKEAAPAQGLGV